MSDATTRYDATAQYDATAEYDATAQYDVVVIGAGPAGENVAGRTAVAGLRVAIVERELVGGECSYWACVPSKTLIRPGDVLAAARRAPGAAEAVTGPIDVEAALARRDEMVSNWDDTTSQPWLTDRNVDVVRGTGRLAGERTVEVTAADGSVRRLHAERAVVVATGSRAAVPDIDGLRGSRPWDNRDITAAKEVPARLLVLGGGPVGAEMTQAFRRLGAREVTLLESADRLLLKEEPFAGAEVKAAFEAEGIAVVVGAQVASVSRDGVDGPVTATLADGRTYVGDELLVAAGRHPATDDMGLASVGLVDGTPIEVDDRLRATRADGGWLYAVGDCNGKVLLTHVGKYQARICADVILGKDARDEVGRDLVPRVTFTDPQVCAVGLTEEQARERGIDIRTVSFGTGDVTGASVQGRGISGTSKLVVDAERGVLVGATFTGPGVQELLHSATVAVVGQIPLSRLWHAVPTYPTVSEVWLRLLEAYGL
jgi:pyruvate/2-oxoglutarate dehydrogenase complex dihydrolipoamide dehydrogenase (E3) component